MKNATIAFASLVCLVFVVYARSSSEKALPTVSISSPTPRTSTTLPFGGNGGGFGGGQFGRGTVPMDSEKQPEIERRQQLGKMKYDPKRWQPNRLPEPQSAIVSLGEIPDRANELVASLNCLQVNTLHSFERSPLFGVGREPPPTFRHSPLPDGADDDSRWQLHQQLTAKLTGYQAQWTWLVQLQGITPRGFVYKAKDRHIVGMPKGLASEEFLREITSADVSGDLNDDEKVWDVIGLQLVSLLMHVSPVVYDNRLLIEEKRTGQTAATREPDQFEMEALEKLRTGAERVMAWRDQEDSLQMLGAIRAKESCMECHDVKVGYLLGAFSYRIKEANRR